MSYSLLVSTEITPAPGGGTSPSIDTTGCDLLVMIISFYAGGSGGSLSDNKGNTWTLRTLYTDGTNNVRIAYVDGTPIVGSGHTFTLTGTSFFSCTSVLGFSGSDSPAYDTESGASLAQPGSVTPSRNNSLLVTGVTTSGGTNYTVDSGFNLAFHHDYSAGNNMGHGSAYKIQTTLGAENPTWSGVGAAVESDIAVFKSPVVVTNIYVTNTFQDSMQSKVVLVPY